MKRDIRFEDATQEHVDTVMDACDGDIDRTRAALVAEFQAMIADVDLLVADGASWRASALAEE